MIDQNTIILKLNNDQLITGTPCKKLILKDTVLSATWDELTYINNEGLVKTPSSTISNPIIKNGEINIIQKKSVNKMFYFNEYEDFKFTENEYIYTKTSDKWQFIKVENIKPGDILLRYTNNNFEELLINQTVTVNEERIAYKLYHTSPTIIAGEFVVCSKVEDNYFEL